MTMLYRIAERVLNRPLLIHKDKIPLILGVLEGRIPITGMNVDPVDLTLPEQAQRILYGPKPPAASQFVGQNEMIDPNTGKPVQMPYRMHNGAAIIPVLGSLVNRGAWLGSSSGETSYEGLQFQVKHAAANPQARSIILDIESPGGEAVGAFETANVIRNAASQKTVIASVNGMAASAAYALASGANKIVTNQTGVLGSIGVILLHADYSRALDKKGITTTLIFAGKHKADGNPFEPLPESVRADLQAEVNKFYDMFTQTVAAGRQGLTAEAIMLMEAQTFIGEDAVKMKLADMVGTFEDALAMTSPRGSGSMNRIALTSSKRKTRMDINNTGEPAAVNAGPTDLYSAAQLASSIDNARKEGIAEGKKAVQDRFAAILAHKDVAGRETTALKLAIESPEMSAEKVVEFVASLPKPAASAPPSIAERMAGRGAELALGGPAPIQSQQPQRIPNAASIYEKRRAAVAATQR